MFIILHEVLHYINYRYLVVSKFSINANNHIQISSSKLFHQINSIKTLSIKTNSNTKQVKDGRWGFMEVPIVSMEDRELISADVFGRMRSPWNVNDRPHLTRGLGDTCGISSTEHCESVGRMQPLLALPSIPSFPSSPR